MEVALLAETPVVLAIPLLAAAAAVAAHQVVTQVLPTAAAAALAAVAAQREVRAARAAAAAQLVLVQTALALAVDLRALTSLGTLLLLGRQPELALAAWLEWREHENHLYEDSPV